MADPLSTATGPLSGGGGDVSVDFAHKTLNDYMESSDSSLATATQKAQSGNTVDTLNLELAIQKWSLATDLDSETIKSVANGIRSIIRNISTE